MAKHDSAKKHAKKRLRRQRVADKQRRREEFDQKKNDSLRIHLEENDAPVEFVEAVMSSISNLGDTDPAMWSDAYRQTYSRMKEVGAERAMAELAREEGKAAAIGFSMHLGNVVLHHIPRDVLLRHIPFHDVQVVPKRRQIHVSFRSLQQARGGPGGTIYYSPYRPKIEVDGRAYTVAFSAHAIHRACERLGITWPSYSSLGDIFAFFHDCLEFERCELYPNTLGFTFWERCIDPFWNMNIAKSVLGNAFRPALKYAYRVGYCPAVIEGEFIKAKTLLFPGMTSTPEYSEILSSSLLGVRKRKMLEQANELTMRKLYEEPERFELLKWFHEQGVPQVRLGWPRYAEAIEG